MRQAPPGLDPVTLSSARHLSSICRSVRWKRWNRPAGECGPPSAAGSTAPCSVVTATASDAACPPVGVVRPASIRMAFTCGAFWACRKIVPDGELEAKIFVRNSDIGFVKEGMKAEIRVDAYPFSRFGSLSGSVLHIGDEALPANNLNTQSRFPVYLNIDNQYLMKNKNKYLIKSGQSINVNLIVKQRPIITIFTDIFSNSLDSLKSIK